MKKKLTEEQRKNNAARCRRWYAANKEHAAATARMRRYGLTVEQYEAMFAAQGFKCATCPSTEPGPKSWHVDHCHTSGRVRGILCHHCNMMLGGAKDNPDTLLRAVAYLKAA